MADLVAEMDHETCVDWLDSLPSEMGVRPDLFVRACGGEASGMELVVAARSTTELRDSLGLATPSKRMWFREILAQTARDAEDDEDQRDRPRYASSDEDDDDDEDSDHDDDSDDVPSSSPSSSLSSSSSEEAAPSKPSVPTSATALAALAALDAPPPGAAGGVFSPRWLETVSPAYDAHMGAENLGLALYALCRFVKPGSALEIGGGYTTPWVLQALADNDDELRALAASGAGSKDPKRQPRIAGMAPGTPWYLPEAVNALVRRPAGVMHCVDDMSHAFSTAGTVRKIAGRLGVEDRLRLHARDAWDGPPEDCRDGAVDLLFVDFGVGTRLNEFLSMYWECVSPGGFVVVHSTVTNAATRRWTEAVRRGEFGWEMPEGDSAHHVSLLEPHKRYQNAFTMLQKRTRGWKEPVWTDEA